MRYCPRCGLNITSDRARYCNRCGLSFDESPLDDGSSASPPDPTAAAESATGVVEEEDSTQATRVEKMDRPVQGHDFVQSIGRAALQVAKVTLQVSLILLVSLLMLSASLSFLFRRTVEQAIGNYPLDSNVLEVDKVNHYSESRLNEIGQKYTDPVLDNVLIDVYPPNRVDISAKWAGIFLFELPLTVELVDQKPQVRVTEINGVPFFLVTDNISRGINDGIDGALRDASVKVTSLEIQDAAVSFTVEASDNYTPAPRTNLTLTSPSSNGLTVLTVFNQIGEEFILELDGEQWVIPVNGSQTIEIPTGTYEYAVITSDGIVVARGRQSWTNEVHRLVLDLDLDQKIELSEEQTGE